MDSAEAAPVDIFVGNTNPKATPEKIAAVMKQCAEQLSEMTELEVLEVKCLTNLDLMPNPRTKCWKLTVPYKFKELMAQDELHPAGWSHRPFFPPKQNKAKWQKENDKSGTSGGAAARSFIQGRPMATPTANFMSYHSTGSNSIKTAWIRDLCKLTKTDFCSIQEHFRSDKTVDKFFKNQFNDYFPYVIPAIRKENQDSGRAKRGLALSGRN
jgi:hypothetical protein